MASIVLVAGVGALGANLGWGATAIAFSQGIAATVGSMIDQALFAPSPTEQTGPRLNSLRAQQADYGSPLMNSYGRVAHTGTLIS